MCIKSQCRQAIRSVTFFGEGKGLLTSRTDRDVPPAFWSSCPTLESKFQIAYIVWTTDWVIVLEKEPIFLKQCNLLFLNNINKKILSVTESCNLFVKILESMLYFGVGSWKVYSTLEWKSQKCTLIGGMCPKPSPSDTHDAVITVSELPSRFGEYSSTKNVTQKLRLRLHKIESIWNRCEIGTDKSCIHTGPGRSAQDQFSYPVPNGFNYESDPVWKCMVPAVLCPCKPNIIQSGSDQNETKFYWSRVNAA